MDIRKLYINGEWTDSVSGEYIEIEIRIQKKFLQRFQEEMPMMWIRP